MKKDESKVVSSISWQTGRCVLEFFWYFYHY